MAKYMTVDGIRVEFTDERNILQVIRKAGISVPTFCYYSDLSIYGACRMCVVEDDRGRIMAACSTLPADKMVIKTNTSRLHDYRKMILELLLSSHCGDCTTCEKNGKCRLQLLASRFGLSNIRFKDTRPKMKIDDSSYSIVLNPGKCILCGDCVRMCNEVQHVGAIDFAHRGSNMIVTPAFGKNIADTNCVSCGQCSAVCPTAAITIKSDLKNVWKSLYDKNSRTVVQVAPAVRVALGEEFGLEPGDDSIGKIFTALRICGFDTVFDTAFGADLTIMEETAELVEKITNGDRSMPLFTSCCPGWIRFFETKHPDLMKYVSTCKSPMQMFGAVIKDYYKKADEETGLKTVSVAVMPCTAKKYEAARDEFKKDGVPYVDYVITTQELARMIKELGINFNEIEPSSPDMPFNLSSGGGMIFGVTGGVAEAALRRAADSSTQKLKEIEYCGVRGLDGVKAAHISLGDISLRVAVVSGLGNADKLIAKIKSGEEHFDFVEVMACPMGCISGAGQPFSYVDEKRDRANGLYTTDKLSMFKRSNENPIVTDMYEHGVLKERAHELLHVHYHTCDGK